MTTENEYARIQNTKDRAQLLVQLVNADARAMQAAAVVGVVVYDEAASNYRQSRASLWALLEPKTEETS